MGRVTEPLALFGAEARGRRGGRLPITLTGAADPVPVRYATPVPSAQVKSAVLLAGLNAPGETVVIEREPTRDHTERMLAGFGARCATEDDRRGAGHHPARPARAARRRSIAVPRDPSSAAFPVAAALLVEGSEVLVPGIGLNPTRAGLLRHAGRDGGRHRLREPARGGRRAGGRPAWCGSGRCRASRCRPSARASMIDEYPILAALAATAEGATVMRGVKELRVKESDRIDAMARGLEACGVTVEEGPDWLIVHGRGAGRRAGRRDGGEPARPPDRDGVPVPRACGEGADHGRRRRADRDELSRASCR